MSIRNPCVEQKCEKYHIFFFFFIRKFQFLEVKFSIYLNRRVFLMVKYGEAFKGRHTILTTAVPCLLCRRCNTVHCLLRRLYITSP